MSIKNSEKIEFNKKLHVQACEHAFENIEDLDLQEYVLKALINMVEEGVPERQTYPRELPEDLPEMLIWCSKAGDYVTVDVYKDTQEFREHIKQIRENRWGTSHLHACKIVEGEYIRAILNQHEIDHQEFIRKQAVHLVDGEWVKTFPKENKPPSIGRNYREAGTNDATKRSV